MAGKKSGLTPVVGLGLGVVVAWKVLGGISPADLGNAEHAFAHVGASTTAHTTAVTGHAPAVSGAYSCHDLEQLWEAAGGSTSTAFEAAEVATAESAGDPHSRYANTDGSDDEGLWQINNRIWGGLATYDPMGNAKAAIKISGDGADWNPWVTYDKGMERGQCPGR